MRKEMQLTSFILIFCCYIQSFESHPLDTKWRQSRYIIDNRRNALFSKKTFAPIYSQPDDMSSKYRYNPIIYKRRLFPVGQKDLTVEASIPQPKFYDSENSLPYNPYKVIQELKTPIYDTNATDVQNFIREATMTPESTTEATSTEIISPRTTTWEYKTEEGNQIDNNEKHVYETRIETVSYHQEVILNPPKKEWYKTEGNYEAPEENYEEPEKNYEEPEKNYEEPEKNYEEPEKNYEEPEKNYEEPDKNYEDENQNKFGYVVEGRNYRKYRVEERTPDGFIVGEYGVMSHDDGTLRGVRYTADSGINPKLIYETLIKFLSL